MFWFYTNIIQDKNNPKQAVSDSHPICGSAAYTRLVPKRGNPQRGEQNLIMKIFYKGYSPLKCTCNGRCHQRKKHIPIKIMQTYNGILHAMNEMRPTMSHVSSPHRLPHTCNAKCEKSIISLSPKDLTHWTDLQYSFEFH